TRAGDFTVSRRSDSILFAATLRGLATSNDGGTSWAFDPNNGLANATVPDLYLDALSPSVLYAGAGFRSYRSVDRSDDRPPLGLPDGSVLIPVGVSLSHSGTVYGWGSLGCTIGCAIYRSTNFGSDWTPLTLGVFRVSVTSLLEAQTAAGLLLVFGTQFSV